MIRKGSLTRPRATSRRAKPFSYCTVVESCHSPSRVIETDRIKSDPLHPTRVCDSCVTNHRIVKKHRPAREPAGKAARDTGRSWSGQGARPCKSRPRPAVSGDGRLHSSTDAVPRQLARLGGQIRLAPISIRFASTNPRGKPAGLRPFPNNAEWCRCGLVDAEREQAWLPISISTRASGL